MALIMDTKIEKRKRKRRHDFIIDWIMCSKYEKNIIGLVVDIIGGGKGNLYDHLTSTKHTYLISKIGLSPNPC